MVYVLIGAGVLLFLTVVVAVILVFYTRNMSIKTLRAQNRVGEIINILLDDRSLGSSRGQAPPSARPMAEKLGLALEQLSSDFVLADLAPGKHIIEVGAPCCQT